MKKIKNKTFLFCFQEDLHCRDLLQANLFGDKFLSLPIDWVGDQKDNQENQILEEIKIKNKKIIK